MVNVIGLALAKKKKYSQWPMCSFIEQWGRQFYSNAFTVFTDNKYF
jgi:hypothetical protein